MINFVVLGPKLEPIPESTTHADPFRPIAEPLTQVAAACDGLALSRGKATAMTFMQNLTICRMDENYTRWRVVEWVIQMYSCRESTVKACFKPAKSASDSASDNE